MDACHLIELTVESNDPLLVPHIIKKLNDKLSLKCESNIGKSSWSVHACDDTIIKITTLIPEDRPFPLSKPMLKIWVAGMRAFQLVQLVKFIDNILSEEFPGQTYLRLAT